MSKARPPRSKSSRPAAAATAAVVDHGFIPVRAKLIEVAAFLDRVERHGVAGDFRCAALREAAELLVDGKPERARRILLALSDPTTTPDEKSTGKAAFGAWGGVKGKGKGKGRGKGTEKAARVKGKVRVKVAGKDSPMAARLPKHP